MYIGKKNRERWKYERDVGEKAGMESVGSMK